MTCYETYCATWQEDFRRERMPSGKKVLCLYRTGLLSVDIHYI